MEFNLFFYRFILNFYSFTMVKTKRPAFVNGFIMLIYTPPVGNKRFQQLSRIESHWGIKNYALWTLSADFNVLIWNNGPNMNHKIQE